MGDRIRLTADGVAMEAYVAVPAGPGKHPGIVLMHHQSALDGFTCDFADRLAAAGYAAIAPDNYHHSSADLALEARKEQLDDGQMLADIGACIAWLQADPRVASDRLAIMGHCMGGRTTFLGAAVHHVFRAAVVWYGGGTFQVRGRPGQTVFERMPQIACPVLGFFGKQDKNPSPEDVSKIDAALSRAGVPHEFHSYDGAGHAFCNWEAPERYHEAASQDSWARMLAFVAPHLASAKSALA